MNNPNTWGSRSGFKYVSKESYREGIPRLNKELTLAKAIFEKAGNVIDRQAGRGLCYVFLLGTTIFSAYSVFCLMGTGFESLTSWQVIPLIVSVTLACILTLLLILKKPMTDSDFVKGLSSEAIDFLYAVYIKDNDKVPHDSELMEFLDLILGLKIKHNGTAGDDLGNDWDSDPSFDCTRSALAGGEVDFESRVLWPFFRSKMADVIEEYRKAIQKLKSNNRTSEIIELAKSEFQKS